MRTALSRLEREALQRREAKRCKAGGHPASLTFWQEGDYATPDKLVCGRCFVVLARRRHGSDRARTS
jgi:hypothetical protein